MDLPSKRVLELRRKVTRISNLVGADLKNPRLYHPRLILIALSGMTAASVIQVNGVYMAWPNLLKICQSLFFTPLILQIFARIINRYRLNDEAINLELQDRLVKFNKNNERNLKYREILMEKLDICSSFVNVFFFGYFIVIHTPFTGTIVSAALTGTYQLMAPIYLPYFDPNKLSGFIINSVVQLFLTVVTFLGLIALDFQFMFFSYQIASMFDILTTKFKELGRIVSCRELKPRRAFKDLVRKRLMKNSNNRKIIGTGRSNKELIIQLIKEYNEITEYTSLLFKLMRIPVFMTITSGGLALCLSVLMMLTYSKVIGTLGIFFYLFQIATWCIIVTFVIHQYKKFLDEIYEFPWYLLSNSDQKIFLQFMHNCQNFDDFELPMIGTVDMELLTTVVYAGYTYLMFIFNFVEIKNNFLN